MALSDADSTTPREGALGGIKRRLLQRVRSVEDFFGKRPESPKGSSPTAKSRMSTSMKKSSSMTAMAEAGAYQLPLHYPRYKKADYLAMPEWQLDALFFQYGLPVEGDLEYKRNYAIGAFLFPDQQ